MSLFYKYHGLITFRIKCLTSNQNICVALKILTILHSKARAIGAKRSNLSNNIVKLGYFQLLMSFTHTIEHIMTERDLNIEHK